MYYIKIYVNICKQNFSDLCIVFLQSRFRLLYPRMATVSVRDLRINFKNHSNVVLIRI